MSDEAVQIIHILISRNELFEEYPTASSFLYLCVLAECIFEFVITHVEYKRG